ncbi:hypothetical protein M011DRAFT_459152 [Sporormia fimetaria CBS 119925]|uniref:Uncharacterized protein n=1 Tax=Sporormia fimetaria CBS 119925 TaxID=1340428 RepID=A0A6A6VAJ6_9PLEO|nr:hypothetical protein M011DRAFT_459152 [Sporormia fimetaria CBS 119925]
MSTSKDTSRNTKHVYIRPLRLTQQPKSTNSFPSEGSFPKWPNATRPTPQASGAGAASDSPVNNDGDDDWDRLSDISSIEDNTTESTAEAEGSHPAQNQQHLDFHDGQRQRKEEQMAINQHIVDAQQASEVKKRARREWFESGGVTTDDPQPPEGRGWRWWIAQITDHSYQH